MFVVVVFAGFGAAIVGHMLAAWQRPHGAGGSARWRPWRWWARAGGGGPALLPVLEALDAGRLQNTGIYSWAQLVPQPEPMRAAIALFAPTTLRGLHGG
jgi:hypothetical protein